jgi:acetoin utilization deacetylase AcuC-like enzyme/GNAT superfamily N-acetyltransferase
MIRIRKITNPYLDANIRKIEKVKEIIKEQFPLIRKDKINIDSQFLDQEHKYQAALFVAEDISESVRGFALLLYMSDKNFCFLDYLAVSSDKSSSGIGGALYERVREEAGSLDVIGIFFECLPDDPELCNDPAVMAQNRKRLAFYERFGARPIANTMYATPIKQGDECPPYLVYDGLGKSETISNNLTREVVKAILERKYGEYCDETYNNTIINSITDDPVSLRPPRYIAKKSIYLAPVPVNRNKKIFLTVNNRHLIHHVKERGYVESPVRIKSIIKELEKSDLFWIGQVKEYSEKHILEVHDPNYFRYFKKVCSEMPKEKSIYPYVFPIRHPDRAPKDLSVRAGYYCFDTFTPLNQNAYLAARWGVNCSLTAADELLAGTTSAYVLTRPPGHHTERSVFGGFCYLNNCAIAAHYLSKTGKVAILDIDYHHGNGQQQIFYNRKDVLTISIHGHPSFAYPYFSGFAEEKGEGEGYGFNHNFPLPEKISSDKYEKKLIQALKLVSAFKPDFFIIALGLDPAKGDPTGTWSFTFEDFYKNGKLIGSLKLPTLIIQEGGYKNRSLGTNARAFFTGYYKAWHGMA